MKRKPSRLKMLILALFFIFIMTCGVCYGQERSAMENNLINATVTVFPQNTVYTGVDILPEVNVQLFGKNLVEGTDYIVSIPEIRTSGIHFIGISGTGNYTGTYVAGCSVLPIDLSQASIEITRELTTADLSEDKNTIATDAIQSVIKIKQFGVDVSKWCTYTTSISGNSIVITAAITNGDGINVVNSSISSTFPIKTDLRDCFVEILEYKQIYSGEELKPSVTVYNLLTNEVLTENIDYFLEYQENVNVGFATVTAKGMGNYTGTNIMSFAILPKDLYNCTTFFSNGRSSSAFTGTDIQPLVTVRDGLKKVLVKDTDYYIIYKDQNDCVLASIKDAGIYKVTVSGMYNYFGSVELEYEVIGTDIDNYRISLQHNRVKADGKPKVPEIKSVKLGEKSMLTTSEYDVSYLDPSGNPVTEMIKPGVYTVVVTAKNGFSGTITTTFEIVGAEQEITGVKNTYKAYKKTANFKLEPVASGDGTGFTFESSNPSVATVSADGVVDVKKLGRAVITIKTTGETVYQPAEKSVIVMVYPYKAVMNQKPWTDGAKKSFKVRWETQPDVTYYQVRYSRNKNFKSGTYNTKKVTQNTKGYKTQSTTIKNLKSGQKYYVKVRAVKVVENELGEKLYYYGTWSSWKSVKTK